MKHPTSFVAEIDGRKLKFSSDRVKRWFEEFLDANQGARVKVGLDAVKSKQQLGFFYGAVLPYFALQHFIFDDGKWRVMDLDEVEKTVKREWNPVFTRDLKGEVHQEGGGIRDMTHKEMNEFLNRVSDGFRDIGYEYPESMFYNQWMETAPGIDEEYPPLTDLRKQTLLKLAEMNV